MTEPPTIDHNPHEKRMTNVVWWILWGGVTFGWATYLYSRTPDWHSIALGGFTMAVLATWAIEITGNKWPFSGGGKPPRS